MKKFETGNLSIDIEWNGDRVLVRWRGESDARDPGATLKPFFDALLPLVGQKDVRLNFRGLSYMNSSTVSPIMQFIRELSGSARKVVVVYEQALQWQATSFRAMRVVTRKWPNVEVVGE